MNFQYICLYCENPCFLEIATTPSYRPTVCPFNNDEGDYVAEWEIFTPGCAVCGKIPAEYISGRNNLCSKHKRLSQV